MYAHYYRADAKSAKANGCKYQIIISPCVDLSNNAGIAFPCKGKADAREIARKHCAMPYNF